MWVQNMLWKRIHFSHTRHPYTDIGTAATTLQQESPVFQNSSKIKRCQLFLYIAAEISRHTFYFFTAWLLIKRSDETHDSVSRLTRMKINPRLVPWTLVVYLSYSATNERGRGSDRWTVGLTADGWVDEKWQRNRFILGQRLDNVLKQSWLRGTLQQHTNIDKISLPPSIHLHLSQSHSRTQTFRLTFQSTRLTSP